MWKKRNERPNAGGVSISSRSGAPSRKRCVVNGQMTEASNKRVPLLSKIAREIARVSVARFFKRLFDSLRNESGSFSSPSYSKCLSITDLFEGL